MTRLILNNIVHVGSINSQKKGWAQQLTVVHEKQNIRKNSNSCRKQLLEAAQKLVLSAILRLFLVFLIKMFLNQPLQVCLYVFNVFS